MQNEMKDCFSGLKRAGPVTFEGRGASPRLRFVSSWSLGGSNGELSDAGQRKGQSQTPVSKPHAEPPHDSFKMVDDLDHKRVGMMHGTEGSAVRNWRESRPQRRQLIRLLPLLCVPIGIDGRE